MTEGKKSIRKSLTMFTCPLGSPQEEIWGWPVYRSEFFPLRRKREGLSQLDNCYVRRSQSDPPQHQPLSNAFTHHLRSWLYQLLADSPVLEEASALIASSLHPREVPMETAVTCTQLRARMARGL